MEPRITLRNNGANAITSVDIHYRVNEEETQTYTWSGNLEFLESEVVSLPSVSFQLEDVNELYINTVDPNGVPDEYTANDTMVEYVDRAEITPVTVKLMIRTDDNPDEITWEILNSSGEVIYSGGPYANPTTIYNETFQLGDLECYKFMIYDEGGDGLLIPGFYALYHGSNNYIKSGTEFGAVDSAYFEVNTQVGIDDRTRPAEVTIHPNPAWSSFNVEFFTGVPTKVSILVYDLSGSQVLTIPAEQLNAGPHSLRIDATPLKPGMYLVQIITGSEVQTKKITIVQ
jgi:hypothetical protein